MLVLGKIFDVFQYRHFFIRRILEIFQEKFKNYANQKHKAAGEKVNPAQRAFIDNREGNQQSDNPGRIYQRKIQSAESADRCFFRKIFDKNIQRVNDEIDGQKIKDKRGNYEKRRPAET